MSEPGWPAGDPDQDQFARPADPALPPPFGTAERVGGVYALFLIMWVSMVVLGGVLQFFLGFIPNALITELVVILLPILLLLQKRRPLERLKLRRAPQPAMLMAGLLGVAALAVILVQLGHWIEQVFPMPDLLKDAYLRAITADSVGELLLLVLVAGVAPGICEEVAFRGYFQQIFAHRHGRHYGILIAAGLFALMHLDPWHFVALFLIGIYLGYLFAWTGSLWVPAAAHFLNNAASVILVYALPDASLSRLDAAPPFWTLLLAVPLFAFTVAWLRRNAVNPESRTEYASITQ